jgi:hypothetical protein
MIETKVVITTAAELRKTLNWNSRVAPPPRKAESLAQALYPHLPSGLKPQPKPNKENSK